MKKSELKEIIKSEFLTEKKDSKKGNESEQKRMEGAIRDDRDHIKNLKKDIEANEKKLARLKKDYKRDVVKEEMDDKMDEGLLDFLKKKEKEAPKSTGSSNEPIGVDYDGNYIYKEGMDKDDMDEEMNGDDMDEMMRGSAYEEDDTMREAEEVDVDVDVEDDIEIDDVSDKSEIEVDSELAGEDADVSAILGLLTKAQANARELGDEKLMDQIGNTITYYTRAHVVNEMEDEEGMREEMDDKEDKEKVKKEELNEEFARFKKLAGLIK